jgi:uncharacterized membrane protein
MRILPVVVAVFVVLVLGGAALMWFGLRRRRIVAVPTSLTVQTAAPAMGAVRLPFRWSYVAVPLAVLAVTVGAAVFFYRLLPPRIVFGYGEGGVATRDGGRDVIIAILLAGQVVFAFGSAAVALIVAKIAERVAKGGAAIATAAQSITSVMSNMVVLPQLILCYLTLDILVFNARGMRLPSVLLFTVLVIAVGGAVLGVLLVRAIQQARVVK